MKNIIKTILFISAYAPMLLVLAYMEYDKNGLNTVVFQLLVISILGMLAAFLIMFMANRFLENITFTAKKSESNDTLQIAFIGSYFIPLLLRSFELNYTMILVVSFIMFLFLWNTMKIQAHPLLYFLKYRFYKVESDNGIVYTLLSKNIIRDPKNIQTVKLLTDSMLIEVR